MRKLATPKKLIFAGIIFIIAAAVYELIIYPWGGSYDNSESTYSVPSILDPSLIEYSEQADEAVEAPPEDETPDQVVVSDLDALYQAIEDAVPPNTLLGVVDIPRVRMSRKKLYEGTDRPLKSYLGHTSKTAMPGKPGNCVIAGHRVSSTGSAPFRYLNKLVNGDLITITTDDGSYTYEVFESFIVDKKEVWVMEPVEGYTHVLTLVTCDPVVYPTSRPNRLIVRASLIS